MEFNKEYSYDKFIVGSLSTLEELSREDTYMNVSNLDLTSISSSTILTTVASETSYQYGSINQQKPKPIVQDDVNQTSVLGSSLNLVNAIIGTGIIGLPLALHLCGFWLGIFILISIAYLSCLTMHITILCGLKTRTFSLVSLCENLIGHIGSHVINFIIFFHTAGSAVAYYILLGDTLPSLINLVVPDYPFLSDRRNVVLMFGLFVTLPLSLSRSTANFAKWSAMSVVLLSIMILGVFIRVPYYLSVGERKIELEAIHLSKGIFKGLAIMSLSFGCAQNLFGVYTTSRDQKPSKWLLTCSIAIGIAFLINVLFAVLAYLCFGKDVQANVLLNFPENDPGIRLVKLTLGLFMVLTIPLAIHPCREAMMLMFGININNSTNKQHYLITLLTFSIILYLGCTMTSLGKIFDMVGGFSTIFLGFFVPGSAYIYLFSNELFYNSQNTRTAEMAEKTCGTWKLYIASVISVIIAIPVMYISVKDALFG